MAIESNCAFRIPLLVIVLCFAFAYDAPAMALQSDSNEIALDKLRIGQTAWHGVYSHGKKVGHSSNAYKKRELNGLNVITFEQTLKIEVVAFLVQFSFEVSEELDFESTSPYRLVSGRRIEKSDGDETQTTIKIEKKELTAEIIEGGQKRQKTLANFQWLLSDTAKSELRDYSRVVVGDKFDDRDFDFEELRITDSKSEVKAVKKTVADGVPIKFYEVDSFEEGVGEVTSRFSIHGELLSSSIADGFMQLKKESPEAAQNIEPLDLAALGEVVIDKPIGDPTEVTEMELRVSSGIAAVIKNGPWQNLRKVKEGGFVVSVGKVHGHKTIATPVELDENLKATDAYPVNHPTIERMTKEAIGDAVEPADKAKRLIAFVSAYITYAPVFDKSVLQICESRRGDCSEHAQLFTTMARAAGLPCREVSGLVYGGDDVQAFGGHAWNEVVIDGQWVPVDATWEEFAINATHIRFSGDDEPFVSAILKLKKNPFQLIKVKLKPAQQK